MSKLIKYTCFIIFILFEVFVLLPNKAIPFVISELKYYSSLKKNIK